MIRAARGEREVHLKDVLKAARISDVHKGTASKHFKRIGVSWRAPRAEPLRGFADAEERVAVCSKWERLPNNYFTHQVDAYGRETRKLKPRLIVPVPVPYNS